MKHTQQTFLSLVELQKISFVGQKTKLLMLPISFLCLLLSACGKNDPKSEAINSSAVELNNSIQLLKSQSAVAGVNMNSLIDSLDELIERIDNPDDFRDPGAPPVDVNNADQDVVDSFASASQKISDEIDAVNALIAGLDPANDAQKIQELADIIETLNRIAQNIDLVAFSLD